MTICLLIFICCLIYYKAPEINQGLFINNNNNNNDMEIPSLTEKKDLLLNQYLQK